MKTLRVGALMLVAGIVTLSACNWLAGIGEPTLETSEGGSPDGAGAPIDSGVDSGLPDGGGGDAMVAAETGTVDSGGPIDGTMPSEAGGDTGGPVCNQGATQCSGLEIQTCSGGTWTNTTSCSVGCANAACLTATAITAGAFHTCVLLSNGTVECWGLNTSGQLGNGSTMSSSSPVPVSNLTTVTAISAGDDFTCALLSSGAVWCWGDNSAGELGTGLSAKTSSVPLAVSVTDGGPTGAIGLAAGGSDACLILPPNNPQNEAVWCWGANNYNVLSSTNGNVTTPLAIGSLNQAGSLSIGEDFICGVVSIEGGNVECMGYNGFENIGDGDNTSNTTVPQDVGNILGATIIAAGGAEGHHACAVISGAVQCWGDNESGELGDNSSSGMNAGDPVAVSSLSAVTAISVGSQTSCAVVANGAVECWGDNNWGELGNNGVTPSPVPVPVSGLTGASAVCEGVQHTCALLSSGNGVECWGYNADGELGNGKVSAAATAAPVAVVW